MSDSGNRSTVRRTARKSVKSASKTRKNSPISPSTSTQQERAFKKLAKKAGIKALTEEHKREVLAAVSAASVSGDFNENALVERLRTFKDVVKARKEEGARAHAKALSRRKKRVEALKQQYEEEKETLARELRRLAKRTGTKVSAKGTIHLAKLRVHGYILSLADHMHLTKHINDRATQKIKEDLRSQAEKDDCDRCALRDYLELV
jgi:hypothetical protein